MFRSFCITIRPRDGITDETIDAVKKWLPKCDYGFAVLEKDGVERHLHAQLWFEKERARGDINKQVQRICERTIKDWDNAQLKVLRSGTRIAYSDWYNDYLAENENKSSPNIIFNNIPDKTLSYYPTEEEQENIQTLKTATDPRFADLEIKCLAYLQNSIYPITIKSVAEYLAYAMFKEKSMKVLLHQRDREALCISLHAYMTKSTDIYLFLKKTKEDIKYEKTLEYIKKNLDIDYKEEWSPSKDLAELSSHEDVSVEELSL